MPTVKIWVMRDVSTFPVVPTAEKKLQICTCPKTRFSDNVSHYPYILRCAIRSRTFFFWASRKVNHFTIRSWQLGQTAALFSFSGRSILFR